MKHVTFADKSLLIDDATADTLIEYTALLSNRGEADTVDIHAFGADGDEVVASLLLSAGSPLMAESTHTSMTEPDNSETLAYMRSKMMQLTGEHPARPMDETMPDSYEDLDL